MKDRISKVGKPDSILLLVIALLVLLGLVVLSSVSAVISQQKFGSPYFYLYRFVLFGLLPGGLLGFFALKMPLAFLKKWGWLLLLINLIFMVLVFLPKIGISAGGASRWINLGFVSFQPSEFLKLTTLLYLAAILTKVREKTTTLIFLVFLVSIGSIGLLLKLQPDISTFGIIAISATIMYFLANTPLKHIFGIFLGGTAAFAFLVATASYRLNRFLVFLNPNLDPMGSSYHIKQVLIAVGSGGIFGKGLGMSIQKLGFIPEPISDAIFSIFSEEAGFIGGLIMISLFLIFAWQGFKIIKKSQDKFSQLLAAGIVLWITLQAFINMGSMVGVLPISGVPLPFVSYGGSALVAELIGVGILLNISRSSKQLN